MWTLLGDPALRLPLLPLTVSLKATSPVCPAARLSIEGELPENQKRPAAPGVSGFASFSRYSCFGHWTFRVGYWIFLFAALAGPSR